MNKILIAVYTTIALAWLFQPTSVQAENRSVACGLYTKAEAQALFQQAVSDGVSKKSVMPAGDSCRYTYSKNGNTYTLKLRVSSSDEIKQEGILESASDVMERQMKARLNNTHATKKYLGIPNLGTDAFWGGEDLWVLKDDTLLIISVHSFLDGTYQNMTEMKKARAEQDKNLSIQVAKVVLGKLN